MNERLEKLRKLMKERHLDAYLVPTSDFPEGQRIYPSEDGTGRSSFY